MSWSLAWAAIKAAAGWANQRLAWIALIGIALYAMHWLDRHDEAIRQAERTACVASITAATNDALSQTLTIKRRQDEIRTAPRTDARTLERLRARTF